MLKNKRKSKLSSITDNNFRWKCLQVITFVYWLEIKSNSQLKEELASMLSITKLTSEQNTTKSDVVKRKKTPEIYHVGNLKKKHTVWATFIHGRSSNVLKI